MQVGEPQRVGAAAVSAMTPARTLTLLLICCAAAAAAADVLCNRTCTPRDHNTCNATTRSEQKQNTTTERKIIQNNQRTADDNNVKSDVNDNLSGDEYDGDGEEDVQVYNLTKNVNVFREAFTESFLPDVLHDGGVLELTDEEYYAMPRLFELEDYASCLGVRGTYCLGTFELLPSANHQLYNIMQRFSSNWVDNYNHTRLHRGVCVSRSCSSQKPHHSPELWFESCVNSRTTSAYNLSARLQHLDYCYEGEEPSPPLTTSDKTFAGFVMLLLLFALVGTALEMTLSDFTKKEYGWALCWSLQTSWRSLVTPATTNPSPRGTDLRFFDGLRVFCMLSVIVEHICWLTTQAYVGDTRFVELNRRSFDGMLLSNSTVIVQIFFLMSTFLLAHKMLQEKTVHSSTTFLRMMFNRLIRISPSYFVVVWFASTWWERLGTGAQWGSLVRAEAAVCRAKWWSQLLYLTNVVNTDDKCLIQTWYLATDLQLYAVALGLLLVLGNRRSAIPIISGLLAGTTLLNLGLAYSLRLVPTFVVHNPELIRVTYRGEPSFDWMYTSGASNAAGALAGLLLAHLHHRLRDTGAAQRLAANKVFRWCAIAAAPVAVVFVGSSPRLLGAEPARLPAAALAALERPVFILLVAFALLGALLGVDSPWRRWMSGGSTLARLSFGALLVHMLLIKTFLATRPSPAHFDRLSVYIEWFGISILSYAAAIPLALLVELPALRLLRELRALTPGRRCKTS